MRILFIVPFTTISYLVATDIYTPSMPSIGDMFARSSDDVQYTLTSFFIGATLSCLVAGYFGDKWCKTRVCVLGSAIAFVGALICLLAPNLETLIAGRFVLGAGATVAPVVGMAILQEKLSPKDTVRIFGLLGIAFSLIPAVAPVVGGKMDKLYGWESNFYIILALMLISLALLYFFLEPERAKDAQYPNKLGILTSYKTVLSHRTFLAYALINPLFYSGEWALLSVLPFYAEECLNMPSDIYGLYIGAIILWFALGSYVGGKLVNRLGSDTVIYIAYTIAGTGAALLLLTAWQYPTSAFLIYVSFSLFTLGFGLVFPATVPKALSVFTTLKGTASSVRGMLLTFVGLLGTYAGVLIDESQLLQLALFIALVAAGGLVVFFWLKPKVPQPAGADQ